MADKKQQFKKTISSRNEKKGLNPELRNEAGMPIANNQD